MKHSHTGSIVNDVETEIRRLLEQFKTEERLSDFEKGQADGLRWALDVVEEIKNPLRGESYATGRNI
jgi:hypothetical protein